MTFLEFLLSRGDDQRSVDYCQQHLIIAREIGDRQSEGKALGNLGITYQSLGDDQRSVDYFQQQLAIAREIRRSQPSNSLPPMPQTVFQQFMIFLQKVQIENRQDPLSNVSEFADDFTDGC
ncbi:MAG: tetratricopeptide repeat protein [Hormoscilla sp. GM102CHS1]|nr:tetratricopeptide repeat protein [Hormoscilla sp. GM102CHS1]